MRGKVYATKPISSLAKRISRRVTYLRVRVRVRVRARVRVRVRVGVIVRVQG